MLHQSAVCACSEVHPLTQTHGTMSVAYALCRAQCDSTFTKLNGSRAVAQQFRNPMDILVLSVFADRIDFDLWSVFCSTSQMTIKPA